MRFTLLLMAVALRAQQPAGVAPDWDTGKLFNELSAQSARLQPMLKQIHPNEWSGAPPRFAALWQDTIAQNQSLAVQAQSVAKSPEKLTDSLRLLETMHSVEESVAELLEGVRKYQNPALAELVDGVQAEGRAARQAFSQRVLDLATEREQQFAVADHEAQRCREILSKQPKR
jgi:hypothetical protein